MKEDHSDMLGREVIHKNLYITSKRNYPITISRNNSGDVEITQSCGSITLHRSDWQAFLNILAESGKDV